MAAQKKKQWSALVAQLGLSPAALGSTEARTQLREALASVEGAAVAQAAKLIEQHALSGFEDALSESLRALSEERQHADPDCTAKEAILAALDAGGCLDGELFARAARYVQRAKNKTGMRDSGARVRARGVLGIARLGHVDAFLIFGAALTDLDANVRLSAARAVTHRGARDGAALLLLRLGLGDGEPELMVECLRGLFVLTPELALDQARTLLEASPRSRELALSALGSAPTDSAVELLEWALRTSTLSDDREQAIHALGLSLRPRARSVLLSLLESEHTSDALYALRVLAFHRYDTRLAEQVRDRTAGSRELAQRVEELFG